MKMDAVKKYFTGWDFFTVCRFMLYGCFLYRFILMLFVITPGYIDLDQTLMWYGTVCFANGFFPEPHFFGQSYGLMLESLAAVPLYFLQVPLEKALVAVTILMSFFPFVYLSKKCKKDHPVLSLVLLALPFWGSYGVDLLTSVPRSLFAGYIFSVPGAVLLSEGKNEKQIMYGVILLYIGLMAVSPTLLLFLATLPFAWKNQVFRKEKLKFFISGNLIGGSIMLTGRMFYIFFPDYNIHKPTLLPAGWSFFKDNIINFPSFCKSILPLFPDNHIYIYIYILLPLCIAAITILFIKQRNFKSLLYLFLLYSGTIPILFTLSRTCDYAEGSLLYGMHRFYLYLFPATALSLYLTRKTFSLKRSHTCIITALLTLSTLFLVIYKLHTFPRNHERRIGNQSFAIEELNELKKCMDSTEKIFNDLKPDGVIIQSSAFAYAFAAKMYGKTSVYIPNYDRKTWDYYKTYDKTGTRHFLVRFFDGSPRPFLILKLDHGKSLKDFFDNDLHGLVLDARKNSDRLQRQKYLQKHGIGGMRKSL